MNRNDRACARRNCALDQLRVDIRCGWIDIYEHRPRSAVRYRFGRCDECVRCCNYFITRLDADRQQAEVESRSSAAQRDAVLCPAEFGELAFEFLHLFALNEGCVFADAIEC